MKLLLTGIVLLLALNLAAQPGHSSIGIRFGGLNGVTYKYIDSDLKGFELIAGGREDGFRLTGMYQKYNPVFADRLAGLFMFLGAGAHSGYTRYTEVVSREIDGIWYYTDSQHVDPVFGGDFILGAEYRFENAPIQLSLDYKPYFDLFGEEAFRLDLWDFGFSIKYAIN